jgi:hypothetical protein
MAQRNPNRIAQLALVGALITFAILTSVPTFWETYRYKPKIDPLAEFRDALKDGIVSVEFSAASNCKKEWRVQLDASELNEFLARATAVDTDVMRSHIQRIHEARALIATKSKSLEYLAIVSAQQPHDLLLERRVVAPGGDGAPREWIYDEIRFPNLGNWLQQKTPGGAL